MDMIIEKANTQYGACRIPGLVLTKCGTLLGYYECRSSSSDWAQIDLKVIRNIRHGMDYSLLQDLIELGVYDDRELADSIMRLRKQGLIELTKANEDIHEVAFKLTSQGVELWEQINNDYDKATEIMFRGMTEEQIETYGRLSQMVIDNIDKEMKKRGYLKERDQ